MGETQLARFLFIDGGSMPLQGTGPSSPYASKLDAVRDNALANNVSAVLAVDLDSNTSCQDWPPEWQCHRMPD